MTSVNETKIEGLSLIDDFISVEEEKALLEYVAKQEWSPAAGKREVQQYGYEYNYANKGSTPKKVRDIPQEFKVVIEKVQAKGFKSTPDQIIVNKYEPGQGIAAHTDHVKHFGPVIASLTTGSGCMMEFTRRTEVEGKIITQSKQLWLAPRSLLVLSGEARYSWMHAIAARKNDIVGSKRVPRGVRISFTFRTMNKE